MGVGFSGNFVLEFVKVEGSTTTTLGSVKIPTKTALELNASGGESLELGWTDESKDSPELVASDAMTVLPELKGALG